MNLSDYERRKFELAEILRGAAALRQKPDPGAEDPIQPLFARLAEDRFNLVVVGRFSRGKSSLMNAILGMDRLPTGIVPLTSVITAVSYGSQEGVTINYAGRRWRSEVKLEELAQYVTQEGNPGNVREVEVAEVQLPAEILRRGFYFIDTPGLGSAITENTRTTEAFLPAADAFLLVTGYESPLSGDELRFLEGAVPSARRIFIAINKQDVVAPHDREQALAFVRRQLETVFEDDAPPVFSTSATEGLRAKQAHDATALAESGVGALEDALLNFFVREKSTEFLLRICDRVVGVLQALPPSSALDDLQSRLADVRRLSRSAESGEAEPTAIGGLAPVRSEKAISCEICRAVESASFDFLAKYQYDLVVSLEQQHALAQGGGLCGLHTWLYNNIASPQGICVGYPELLERWAETLARLGRDAEAGDPQALAQAVRAELPTPETCPVCGVCDRTEAAALAATAARLDLAEGDAADALSAICLPHLPKLLAALHNETAIRHLLVREAGLFERVAEDMRRYALKFDGRRRPLASDAEHQSSGRALRMVAGLRNMSFAKRLE
jgi:GTP-binding protein EngB required for normal cell division